MFNAVTYAQHLIFTFNALWLEHHFGSKIAFVQLLARACWYLNGSLNRMCKELNQYYSLLQMRALS